MKTVSKVKVLCLFILSFFLLSSGAVSATTLIKVDTAIYPIHTHTLNKQQFLQQYGTDDSTRALIKYYFPKRKTGVILSLFSGGTFLLSGILSVVVIYAAAGANFLAFLLALTLVSTAIVAFFLLIAGIVVLALHSRKRLLRTILKYKEGEPIPKNIRNKNSFQRLVEKEQASK